MDNVMEIQEEPALDETLQDPSTMDCDPSNLDEKGENNFVVVVDVSESLREKDEIGEAIGAEKEDPWLEKADGSKQDTIVCNEESDTGSEHSFLVLDEVESVVSDEDIAAVARSPSPKKRESRKQSLSEKPSHETLLKDISPSKKSKIDLREELKELNDMEDEIGMAFEEISCEENNNAKDDVCEREPKREVVTQADLNVPEFDTAIEAMAEEENENQLLFTEVNSILDSLCHSEEGESTGGEDEKISDCENVLKTKPVESSADSESVENKLVDSVGEDKEENKSEDIPIIENCSEIHVEDSRASAEACAIESDKNSESDTMDTSSDNNVSTTPMAVGNTLDKKLHQEECETVVKALVNVVSLQFDLNLSTVTGLRSVSNKTAMEKQSLDSKEERGFPISDATSLCSNVQVVLEESGRKRASEEQEPLAKKPKFDCEETCANKSTDAADSCHSLPSPVVTAVTSGSSVQTDGNKLELELQAGKAHDSITTNSSTTVHADESNSTEGSDIVISRVQTCTENSKPPTNAVESQIQAADKFTSASQSSQCSSDSEPSLCKLLHIDGNLKEIIEGLSSDSKDSSVAKENSSSEKTEIASPSCDVAIVKSEPKSEPPEFEAARISAENHSIMMESIAFLDGNSKKSVVCDDKKNISLQNGSFQGLSSAANLTNGHIAPELIINNLPSVIDASNEHLYLKVHESDLNSLFRQQVHKYCMTTHKHKIKELEEYVNKLKQDLAQYVADALQVRTQLHDMATKQNNLFRNHSYNTKVERRTVGVNVRIVQVPSNAPVTSLATSTSQSNSASTNNMVGTVLQGSKNATPNTSVPLLGTALGGKVQQSPVVKGVNNPTPSTSVKVLTSNSAVPSASLQIVDLTDDDSPKRKPPQGTVTTAIRAPGPVRAQLPPRSGAPQNLVSLPVMTPLSSVMQLLPSGTSLTNTLADGSTLRMVRPANARVTYFMSGAPGTPLPVIQQIGGSPPRVVGVSPQQFSNISNARPTFFLAAQMPVATQASSGVRSSTPSLASMAPTFKAAPALPSTSSGQLTLTPVPQVNKHPAPLPLPPVYQPNPKLKALPPKPTLKISNHNGDAKGQNLKSGIVLSWSMSLTTKHAEIASYQLYAYQENKGPVSYHLWKKVGDIKALPLPMACTLTQFVPGHKYHFSVRAVDVHKRLGPFSEPANILLVSKPNNEPSPTQSSSSG